MKSLRIICGALGGLHYSSTPDLALDTCPVCGEACREIEVEVEVKKTLLDLLYDADAVQIDDNFVRYFHMEYDDCEEGEDIAMDAGTGDCEYFFTVGQLTTAVESETEEGWEVEGDRNGETFLIIPYKLAVLKA